MKLTNDNNSSEKTSHPAPIAADRRSRVLRRKLAVRHDRVVDPQVKVADARAGGGHETEADGLADREEGHPGEFEPDWGRAMELGFGDQVEGDEGCDTDVVVHDPEDMLVDLWMGCEISGLSAGVRLTVVRGLDS